MVQGWVLRCGDVAGRRACVWRQQRRRDAVVALQGSVTNADAGAVIIEYRSAPRRWGRATGPKLVARNRSCSRETAHGSSSTRSRVLRMPHRQPRTTLRSAAHDAFAAGLKSMGRLRRSVVRLLASARGWRPDRRANRMGRRAALVATLLVAVAARGGATGAEASTAKHLARLKNCGVIAVFDYGGESSVYRRVRTRGHLTCRRAKQFVWDFMAGDGGTVPGWSCRDPQCVRRKDGTLVSFRVVRNCPSSCPFKRPR